MPPAAAISFAACLALLSVSPAWGDGTRREPHDLPAGDLTLRFLEDPDTGSIDTLRILRGDKVLYEGVFETLPSLLAAPAGSPEGLLPLGLDADVTGDGRPDLVLQSFTGGDHCCYYTLIFEREPQFQVLAELAGENSPVEWRNLDGDPGLEPVLRDWTFAHWKTDVASAPAPEVVLDLVEGGYVGAPELMRRPPPPDSELATRAAGIAKALAAAGRATPQLWGPMLDLIYGGNAAAAFSLADRAWPPDLPGKSDFLVQFGAQLSYSPYWDTVMALNGWSAEP